MKRLDENLKYKLLSAVANQLIMLEELNEIVRAMFVEITNVIDIDACFVYVFDADNNNLKLLHFEGIDSVDVEGIHHIAVGEDLCGYAVWQQSQIVTEDIQQSDVECIQKAKQLGIKSYVCYPLYAQDRLLGTLSFGLMQRTYFSRIELSLLEEVARLFATRMERALRITELNHRFKELRTHQEQARIAKQVKKADDNGSYRRLIIKEGNDVYFIPADRILFIEKIGRKSHIYTVNKEYTTNRSIAELLDLLPAEHFFLSHRSYIINLSKLSHIMSKNQTYLAYFHDSTRHAHISKLKIEHVQQLLEQI